MSHQTELSTTEPSTVQGDELLDAEPPSSSVHSDERDPPNQTLDEVIAAQKAKHAANSKLQGQPDIVVGATLVLRRRNTKAKSYYQITEELDNGYVLCRPLEPKPKSEPTPKNADGDEPPLPKRAKPARSNEPGESSPLSAEMVGMITKVAAEQFKRLANQQKPRPIAVRYGPPTTNRPPPSVVQGAVQMCAPTPALLTPPLVPTTQPVTMSFPAAPPPLIIPQFFSTVPPQSTPVLLNGPSTTTAAPHTPITPSNCILCLAEGHSTSACPYYKSFEGRVNCLTSRRICALCISPGHLYHQCRAPHACKHCLAPHNVVCCPRSWTPTTPDGFMLANTYFLRLTNVPNASQSS